MQKLLKRLYSVLLINSKRSAASPHRYCDAQEKFPLKLLINTECLIASPHQYCDGKLLSWQTSKPPQPHHWKQTQKHDLLTEYQLNKTQQLVHWAVHLITVSATIGSYLQDNLLIQNNSKQK